MSQAAGIMAGMEPVSAPLDAVAFSSLARRLAAEARALGLAVPGFRSPPRQAGAVRTLRKVAGGGCIVAVRRRERPGGEVAADLVDGVLAANGLLGAAGSGHRATLLAAAARPGLVRHVKLPEPVRRDGRHPKAQTYRGSVGQTGA